VQLDIWGKKRQENAIYADISWVGFLGAQPPRDVERVWEAVRDARDLAVVFVGQCLSRGEPVTGAQVDRQVEAKLAAAGFGEYIRHRTGHAIDTAVHGFGINLDSKEFPDERPLLEGACFSVEPGLYLSEFGVRSEIDVYIQNNIPVISGGMPQDKILCF
jgi:Xaa-Pro aminopeptidase